MAFAAPLPRLALGAVAVLLLSCGGGGAPSEPVGPLLPDGRTRGSVDFTVDTARLAGSWLVRDRNFEPSDCAVIEGTIATPGVRRLLVFDTLLVNLGELDCVIGDPAAPEPPLAASDFEYHDCHGHRHMHGYAAYELRHTDGTLAAEGAKQGFCLLDNSRVHPAAAPMRVYDCDFQGLQSGWSDLYARTVEGQWVDVTGLPAGQYLLRVTVNAEGTLPEDVDVHPNTAEVAVVLPDPGAPVDTVDDHGDVQQDATALAFPIGLLAAIDHGGDVDWFRVNVSVGRAYEMRVELGTLADSVLRLVAAGGATLASNDDASAGDPSSRIVWTSPLSGPVWLEVSGKGNATGGYRIVVE
jgi:hypothetical protein